MAASYTEADIKSLDWREHIRLRPGMYVGKLGDGTTSDDGIYLFALDPAIAHHEADALPIPVGVAFQAEPRD